MPGFTGRAWAHGNFNGRFGSIDAALISAYANSKRCKVCNHLKKPLAAIEKEHEGWLSIARLCSDEEETWALELLRYEIDYVPSFVLLNTQGEALAKTVRPLNPEHLVDSLQLLVKHAHETAGRPA